VDLRILVIDDDPAMLDLVGESLEAEGFEVERASDGAGGLRLATQVEYDLIVLDLHLPGLDGLSVCRRLRQGGSTVPILILSSRSDTVDKVYGLEVGADDFLTKPFHPLELLARVRAQLRRNQEWVGRPAQRGLSVDAAARRVFLTGREVTLTLLEFNILKALSEHAGQVLSRQQIMDLAWGQEFVADERTVDAHIRNLRAKLRAVEPGEHILSVRGLGYRLA